MLRKVKPEGLEAKIVVPSRIEAAQERTAKPAPESRAREIVRRVVPAPRAKTQREEKPKPFRRSAEDNRRWKCHAKCMKMGITYRGRLPADWDYAKDSRVAS